MWIVCKSTLICSIFILQFKSNSDQSKIHSKSYAAPGINIAQFCISAQNTWHGKSRVRRPGLYFVPSHRNQGVSHILELKMLTPPAFNSILPSQEVSTKYNPHKKPSS